MPTTSTQDLIIEDLLRIEPQNVYVPPPPYLDDQPLEEKIRMAYIQLQRFARMRDRKKTLICAYYLGELLETIPTRAQQQYLSRQLSKYHLSVSRRTYNLFEKTGIAQIERTQHVTVTMISRMKLSEYSMLVGIYSWDSLLSREECYEC